MPLQCHGCGAFTQTHDPEVAGYYDVNRKAVKKFTGEIAETSALKSPEEDVVVDQALRNIDPSQLEELGIDPKMLRHGDEMEPHTSC